MSHKVIHVLAKEGGGGVLKRDGEYEEKVKLKIPVNFPLKPSLLCFY